MTAPTRHLGLALALGVLVLLFAGVRARGAEPAPASVDARVISAFVMHGRIVAAVRVAGEHPGEAITRHWTFAGRSCAGSVCRQLSLRRERSAHRFDRLTLGRVGVGRYAGSGRFFAALRCQGRLYRRGEVVPYGITVDVSQAVAIQGVQFARRLTATYTNRRRTDRTRCPIGPSHDAATYAGVTSALPSPPAAAFSVTLSPRTDSATFTDTSKRGAGGAAIVSRAWNFGDPASGSADTAAGVTVGHRFSAPGTYQVSETITDANGLTSAQTQPVVAAGPPTAAWTAAPVGASLTYQFRDGSTPGIGGARIVAWLWNFGDSTSGPANQSHAQSPAHTFSAPGTYQVCLLVSDANGRYAAHCAALLVAAGQASNRSVDRTAASSPASRAGRLRTGEITAYRQNGRPA
jgi:PKD repeat protein